MKAALFSRRVRLQGCSVVVFCGLLGAGCSERPPPVKSVDTSDAGPREPVVESAKRGEATAPYRVKLKSGAELYLPTWFSANKGSYDLIVHFHGMGKLQENNLNRCQINAAVVSINHGVGTDGYSNAFRDPESFRKLLADTQDEIDKSGRAPNAKTRRIALSAWSAGFVSVAKIMSDPANADKVDAVVLADGFFTSFTNVKKRVINTASLERFVALADTAGKGDKLFAITHSAIPTADYPSVEETVAKLLELSSNTKTPSSNVGPRNMHETYVVDHGSFHVKGFEGVTAGDHIKQINAMGETLYPYLKTRWEQGDATASTTLAAGAPAKPSAPARQ